MTLERADKANMAVETAKKYLDIATRAADGETYASIGKSYSCTRQMVEKILKRLTTNQNMSKMN